MPGRPRGFMPGWQPADETLRVLSAVQKVLDEYADYGAMTVRQVFYRLVGEYGYDKTELAYKRLAEYLVKARRSGIIRFGAIRDDGTDQAGGGGWTSRASFWSSVRHSADSFELDHQEGQAQQIEIWCEAAGMVPMLAQMTDAWHVPVYSTGGFSSVTVTHATAARIARGEVPTAFLHVGDYDPSGESIFEAMTEDIGAFLGSRDYKFEPHRIALTESQVSLHDLPTAPPKKSDSRSAKWVGETTQAEALPPNLLRDIVTSAVLNLIDQDVLDGVLDREASDRVEIDRVLQIAENEEE